MIEDDWRVMIEESVCEWVWSMQSVVEGKSRQKQTF